MFSIRLAITHRLCKFIKKLIKKNDTGFNNIVKKIIMLCPCFNSLCRRLAFFILGASIATPWPADAWLWNKKKQPFAIAHNIYTNEVVVINLEKNQSSQINGLNNLYPGWQIKNAEEINTLKKPMIVKGYFSLWEENVPIGRDDGYRWEERTSWSQPMGQDRDRHGDEVGKFMDDLRKNPEIYSFVKKNDRDWFYINKENPARIMATPVVGDLSERKQKEIEEYLIYRGYEKQSYPQLMKELIQTDRAVTIDACIYTKPNDAKIYQINLSTETNPETTPCNIKAYPQKYLALDLEPSPNNEGSQGETILDDNTAPDDAFFVDNANPARIIATPREIYCTSSDDTDCRVRGLADPALYLDTLGKPRYTQKSYAELQKSSEIQRTVVGCLENKPDTKKVFLGHDYPYSSAPEDALLTPISQKTNPKNTPCRVARYAKLGLGLASEDPDLGEDTWYFLPNQDSFFVDKDNPTQAIAVPAKDPDNKAKNSLEKLFDNKGEIYKAFDFAELLQKSAEQNKQVTITECATWNPETERLVYQKLTQGMKPTETACNLSGYPANRIILQPRDSYPG
jgi:hypothetical protein